MKISASNLLFVTIKKMTHGIINSEVAIELAPSGEVSAQIPRMSVCAPGLKEVASAHALMKSDSIMIGVEHRRIT